MRGEIDMWITAYFLGLEWTFQCIVNAFVLYCITCCYIKYASCTKITNCCDFQDQIQLLEQLLLGIEFRIRQKAAKRAEVGLDVNSNESIFFHPSSAQETYLLHWSFSSEIKL